MPLGLNWCCGNNVSQKDFHGGIKEEGKESPPARVSCVSTSAKLT